MFAGTLMHNLRFGNQCDPSHTDDEIWALCKELGLGTNLIGADEMDLSLIHI